MVVYTLLSSYVSNIYAFTEQEIQQLNDIFGRIIESKIDGRILSLENKIDEKILSLESKIDENRLSLESKISELKEIMTEGFNSNNLLGRSKVKVLKNSTGEVVSPCGHHSTYHTVYYDGYVVALFNPHMACPTFKNVILHRYYDLGILLDRKYLLPYAIDISIGDTPELGDDVIAYGYGDRAKVWGGKISDLIEKDECVTPASHFSGTTRVCLYEYIVQGGQQKGMSGSAVANGCGYLGIAHAVLLSELSNGSYAGVIGVKIIRQFISDNKHLLVKHDNTSIIVNQLPFAPFADCKDSMEVEIKI